jgi:hypothetical protein
MAQDNWQTFSFEFSDGLISNLSPLQHGTKLPGSARILRNFEPSIEGGYRRIEGYAKFDDAQVSAGGNLFRGLAVFNGNAIAAYDTHLYISSGSGWTQLTDNATYSSTGITLAGLGKVRFAQHSFAGTKTLIVVDGASKPFKFDGTTFSSITTATSDQEDATFAVEHRDHLFFGKDKKLTYSAPSDDSDYTIASGAGFFTFKNPITGVVPFRDQLFVFTSSSIDVISGTSEADFAKQSVTKDVGAVNEDTIQEIGGDVIFLGPDGLRLLSATDRINDFSIGIVSKVIQSEMVNFIKNSTSYASVVIRDKSQYRLLGFNSNYTDASALGILGTQLSPQGGESMAWGELRGIRAYVAASERNETNEIIIFANDDGYVYQMEEGTSFDGSDIVATFATPFVYINDPQVRKTFYKMYLYTDPQGSFEANVSLKLDFDTDGTVQPPQIEFNNQTNTVSLYGVSTYGTGSFGGKLKKIFGTQTVGSGFNVSLEFVSESQTPPFSLDAATLEFATHGRR